MTTNTKGLIAGFVILGAASLAYYFLVFKKQNRGIDVIGGADNLEAVKKNLGGTYAKDIAVVKFNVGKNTAQFYNNNRIVIFDASNKQILKGSYSDGGKSLVMDNGKVILGESVWTNLENVLKP